MSAIQPPDDIQQIGQEAAAEVEAGSEMAPAKAAPVEVAPPASDSRGRTWAHGMPAMRVQRARWRLSGKPALAAAAEGADGTARASKTGFPPTIRLVRAAVGIVLLALAWVGALGTYLLAVATFAPLTRQRLIMMLPLRLVEGLGACMLVVVVATLLAVGAFALSLAVRANDPALAPREPPSAFVPDIGEQPGQD